MEEQETTSVAIRNPDVKNTVNLNMNQNDLIDIAIQEKLATLESSIELLDEAIKANRKKHDETRDALITKMTERFKTLDKGFLRFQAIAKAAEMKTQKEIHSSVCNQIFLTVGRYRNSNTSLDNYKDPVRVFKNQTREQEAGVQCPTEIRLTSATVSNDDGVELSFEGRVFKIAKSKQQAFFAKLAPIVKEEIRLKNQYYDLFLEKIQYENGEKRIKAMIMKKSLSKSAEGRGILKMLQDATKIKVLG